MTEEVAAEEPARFVDGEVLVVEPGDTLIVRVGRDTPLATVHEIKRELDGWAAEHMPDVRAVVIACDQLGVYRPAGPVGDRPGESGG